MPSYIIRDCRTAGRCDRVEPLVVFGCQIYGERLNGIEQLLACARADDRAGHTRLRDTPHQCELVRYDHLSNLRSGLGENRISVLCGFGVAARWIDRLPNQTDQHEQDTDAADGLRLIAEHDP